MATGRNLDMTQRDLYLAAYDIADPRRLRAAMERIRAHATGGQKSVYECFLTPAERGDLLADIALVIDDSADRFFLLRLDPRMRVVTLGIARPPLDPPFFLLVS